MKIAVSATKPDTLDCPVDPRFGRCDYFMIVDSETMNFQSFSNDNINATGGAGIAAAQLVIDKGAEIIITGNCGPNAFTALDASGVKVIVDVFKNTVRQAIEDFNEKNSKNIRINYKTR